MAQASHARRLAQRSDVPVAGGGCRIIPPISSCRAITTCVCRARSSATCPARIPRRSAIRRRTGEVVGLGRPALLPLDDAGRDRRRAATRSAEVIAYLKRSAAADGTHPKGTIYFVQNADVRSKVRDALFPVAVEELTKLGVAAKILEGTVPLNKDDVQGVEMGTATFDWKASGSTILPGAICDNFTSFGGAINDGRGQTPLCEFLRYGAAGASGTVTEPYAIADEVPLAHGPGPLRPRLHLGRGVLSVGLWPLPVVDRGRSALPAVGRRAAGVGRGRRAGGRRARHPDTEAHRHPGRRSARARCSSCLSTASARPSASRAKRSRWIRQKWPTAITNCGSWPSGRRRSSRRGGRSSPSGWTTTAARSRRRLATQGVLRRNTVLRIAVQSPGSIGIVAVQGSRIVGRVGRRRGADRDSRQHPGGRARAAPRGRLGRRRRETNVMAQPLEFTVE